MKLKRFKETNTRKIGVFIFTGICVLLVCGVVLYRTFAVFEVRTNQNVIKGTVQDPGNLYFAFYVNDGTDDKIQKDMPQKNSGLVLDEVKSYCGVNGNHDPNIQVSLSEDYQIRIDGVTTSRTKCNLYFTKGIFVKGKGIPVVESGDGLYLVEHPASETEGMEEGWKNKEYRYAGSNPNNYVDFNGEKWRIIGFVNVQTSTGIEQRLKLIRSVPLGLFSWDYGEGKYENDWTSSTLMEMLNDDYYFSKNEESNCYKGTSVADNCDFSEGTMKGLKEVQYLIDTDIIWNIGGYETHNAATVSMFYENERGLKTGNTNSYPSVWSKSTTKDPQTNILSENLFHSIGVIYPSDYAYATNGGTLGRNECFQKILYTWYDGENKTQCAGTDWLNTFSINKWSWTMTPITFSSTTIFLVANTGQISFNYPAYYANIVYPTLYLKPTVQIVSGLGTEDDSFQLVQVINSN